MTGDVRKIPARDIIACNCLYRHGGRSYLARLIVTSISGTRISLRADMVNLFRNGLTSRQGGVRGGTPSRETYEMLSALNIVPYRDGITMCALVLVAKTRLVYITISRGSPPPT